MMDPEKKTIIFLAHTHFNFGGGERSLLLMMQECKKTGYETHVIVPQSGDFSDAAKSLGFKTHIIPYRWWTINNRNEYSSDLNARAILQMSDLINELQPLCCVTNTITCPWLAYASRIRRYPHAWIIREFGDIDHNLTFWMPKEQIAQTVSDLSDKVFVNSETLRKHYEGLMQRRDIDIILPHVAQPSVTNTADPFHEDTLRLVCVGNISEGKGQIDAVKAVHSLKKQKIPVHLILVGLAADQAYMKKIIDYIDRYDLRNQITLTGYQPSPADYVSFADIALVCSKSEAFGRVTIEALKLGVPVIGTDSAGTRDLLQSYAKDLLYRFGDHAQLTDKILALWSDKRKMSRIKSSLHKHISRVYDEKNAYASFFTYLESLKTGGRPDVPPTLAPLNELLVYQRYLEKNQRHPLRIKKQVIHYVRKYGRKIKGTIRQIK